MNIELYKLCCENYDKETYRHAMRVVEYAQNDCRYSFYDDYDKEIITDLAMTHDLIEDTNVSYNDLKAIGISDLFITYLKILTHKKYEPYETYVRNIAEFGGIPLLVKCADMKDHLEQKRTLTPHLKEKYFKVLKYLK